MKKVGIITLVGNKNFGNKFQNYAVQEVLKSLNFSAETIVLKDSEEKYKKKSFLSKIEKVNYKNLKYKLTTLRYQKLNNIRENVFKNFTSNFILEKKYYKNEVKTKLDSDYDYFVVGSDQVWNPYYKNDNSFFFLSFASIPKRIAYSPSFGVNEIPTEYTKEYRNFLNKMNAISVREEAGATIIKELTGRDASVLIDPTLMLNKEKWLSISKRAEYKPSKKYLLTYFLGSVSKENKSKMEKIAIKNNLEIVNLYNVKDRDVYQAGPSEFIDYINSASIFCTDSFHGVIFAMIFEKPFYVFERADNSASMYSRIDTLLAKFQLESRKSEHMKLNHEALEIDYSAFPIILEKEQKQAINFLNKALTGSAIQD